MKTALILGVTGTFGGGMATALQAKGWNIKAVVRNPKKLSIEQYQYQIIQGDIEQKELLQNAAEGVDLIVYGVNPPYEKWKTKARSMLESVALIAEQKKLHIVFPGNVYPFRPRLSPINELVKTEPISEKGRIRVEMEARLLKASQSGARVTIVRAPDYIGDKSQWMDMLLKKKHGHYSMQFPHDRDHRHYWCYLPDLCANTVKLIEREGERFEVWHDQGIEITEERWKQAFKYNGYELKTRRFPWWLLHCISPFSRMIREVLEMKYLWKEPLILDGSKMKRELGNAFQNTDLNTIVSKIVMSH